jgi:hypothetical protein
LTLGRTLLAVGLALAGIGLLLELAPALRLGRLPGDLSFGGSGWRVYVPIGTSLLLSLLLTLIFALVGRSERPHHDLRSRVARCPSGGHRGRAERPDRIPRRGGAPGASTARHLGTQRGGTPSMGGSA